MYSGHSPTLFQLYLSLEILIFRCFDYPILLTPFRPLRGYFYIYLHGTLILQTIISYCAPPTFVRLRITSIRLRLRSPSFPFVPGPNISHIDLAPSIFRCFSSRFINFAPISFVLSLYTSVLVYGHTHPFTFIIRTY